MTNTTTVVEKGKNGVVDATSAKIENLKNSGIDVDGSITKFVDEVLKGLNEDSKKNIKEQVKKYLEEHKNDDDFNKKIDDIHKVCENIFGIKIDNNGNLADAPKTTVKKESVDEDNPTETGGDKPTENGNQKQVELGLIGNMGVLQRDSTTQGRFYGNIDQDDPNNGNQGEGSEGNENGNEGNKETTPKLSKTKQDINGCLNIINDLQKGGNKEKLPQDNKLDDIKKLLEDFNKIIENPIKNNVNELQKYIHQNLPESEKGQFEKDNHMKKDGNFDGQFGTSTLTGLNTILKKMGEYVGEMQKIVKPTSEGTNGAGNEADNGGGAPEKPTEKKQSTQPLDTTPRTAPDGKQHQVLENSQTITENATPFFINLFLAKVRSYLSKLSSQFTVK